MMESRKFFVSLLVVSLVLNLILGYLLFQMNNQGRELNKKINELSDQLGHCQKQLADYKNELEKVTRRINISV